MKVAVNDRGMTVVAAGQCAQDRVEWQAIVRELVLTGLH